MDIWEATPRGMSTLAKLVKVSGLKYSFRGGYGKECISPKLSSKLATVLVEAANHSLASSTWKQYNAVFERLKKITRETEWFYPSPCWP